ncbi:hypothetical protein QCE73_12440 [Caballeronia sp. LZ029]|uniref:hypothetical protein n=1 Tax=Caballeronia sp. LZ029 TaxID=3038564 RepID=UPI0028655052|nr:hypothetical protein [Caballeronia sp. LZ029]MDR5743960.1 hypothetical protein [Caballeronia sp. LZ029]
MKPHIVEGVLISAGRVMSPEEVGESLSSRLTLRGRVGGWYLCGDIHREMYDKLVETNGECQMSLGIVATGGGGTYAIFGVDAAVFRHLFILPLYEPSVIGLLESLHSQPIQVSLGRQDEEAAVLIGARVPWETVSEVLRHRQQGHELGLKDIFEGGKYVLERVRAIEVKKPLDGRASPERASVTFVMPKVTLVSREQGACANVGRNAVH